MDASDLLTHLMTIHLNHTWNGTSENFILNWQTQLCLYENIVDLNDHLSDGQKHTMLKNAVHLCIELRHVKN